MREQEILVFCGVSSIYHLGSIKEYFQKLGVQVRFLENKEMFPYISEEDRSFVTEQEDYTPMEQEQMIPLNEYWVSKKIRSHGSSPSFLASRSKKYLSDLFKEHKIPYCTYYSVEEGISLVRKGKTLIMKPNSLYSGKGVQILEKNNLNQFQMMFQEALQTKKHVLEILDIPSSEPVIFDYIHGVEYSLDIFVYKGTFSIVRLCKKYITIIDHAPCVTAYVLEKINNTLHHFIELWVEALFHKDEVSFGQFDFIYSQSHDTYIPIDFSIRVGGGMEHLLKYTGHHIYLQGMAQAMGYTGTSLDLSGYYQYHFLPTKKGRLIKNIQDHDSGQFIRLKNQGEFITNLGPSANHRIAILLGKGFDEVEFQQQLHILLVGDEYIETM